MASLISANVFDMMNDLDSVKGVIPEGLYLNISNLLKAEYNRQPKQETAPTINNITYNIQNLNISVPATPSIPEPVQEPAPFYRVIDTSDDQLWGHILLNANGEYNPELQGEDSDDLVDKYHNLADAYTSNLSLEEAKYIVDRDGSLCDAIRLFTEDNYGELNLLDGDEVLYRQLAYAIIVSNLDVEEYNP